MKNDTIKKADTVIAATYKRFPLVLTRGKGCTVWDSAGRSYTDFVAGIAVCNLGHAHPRIAQAVSQQVQTLVHVSNLYYTLPQTEVAAWLVENSFADKVFFCNSGAEANEAAIKLARKHFKDKGETSRFHIIAMEQSFHGRTMAALSATGQKKIRQGFDPTLQGFEFVPFNDSRALANSINPSTCAVLLEPIQGEGGIRCPDPDYLKEVRKLCSDAGILLIFDEIQTGMGRTGKLFAYENFGIEPDIMTLAKALANGLPVGAMLAKDFVADAFGPGAHASTFGGTPLVTAAALEVLKTLKEEDMVGRCRDVGAYFKQQLLWLQRQHEIIAEVRGYGLLLGLELKIEGQSLVDKCMQKGFLINCIQDNILRFVPPLIVAEEEIDALVSCLDEILNEVFHG
ncbi:MAG: acetylornithine transaminase [Desulfobacterales bacterium]|jgi:acetylornithine aminotransferase